MLTVELARTKCNRNAGALFNRSYLGLGVGAIDFYGVDYFTAKYRVGLAQLADVLLAEETIVLAEPLLGLQQIFDCLGPELAVELLRTGRILAPAGNIDRFDERLTHLLSPMSGTLTRAIVFRDTNLSRSAQQFVAEAADHCLIGSDKQYDYQFGRVREGILAAWEPIILSENREISVPVFAALASSSFVHGRMEAGQPRHEAVLDLLGGYATLLAEALLLNVSKSLHNFEAERILTSLRVQDASPTFAGVKEVLEFENLPKPGVLVMRGEWDARDVFQCVTSDSADQLRKWLRAHRFTGADFAAEYDRSIAGFPARELWTQTVRFLAVSGLSIAIAHALVQYPIVADALGLAIGTVDQFFADKAFAAWHPRIWVGEYAENVRRPLAGPESRQF